MSIYNTFLSLNTKCDKFMHYFPIYDQWFNQYIGTAPRILEIGVNFGGSAELWREYFGKGTHVVGVDIANRADSKPFLELVNGNQGDPNFWDKFINLYKNNKFNLIIDDGSHEPAHQILTLEKTFNSLLEDNGIYLCEDVRTSYYKGVRVNGGGLGNPDSFIEYTKRLIDVINADHTRVAIGVGKTPDGPHVDMSLSEKYQGIKSVNFYDSVVVIEKNNLQQKFNRVNSDSSVVYPDIDNPPESWYKY
jgi:SAM-dependent methyltransferase